MNALQPNNTTPDAILANDTQAAGDLATEKDADAVGLPVSGFHQRLECGAFGLSKHAQHDLCLGPARSTLACGAHDCDRLLLGIDRAPDPLNRNLTVLEARNRTYAGQLVPDFDQTP